MNVPELSPLELAQELESENPPIVVDVREEFELEISGLPNTIHIPMMDIPARMRELDPASNIVVICRSGVRSRDVSAFLIGQGFANVRNLDSGMNGWADTVDARVTKY